MSRKETNLFVSCIWNGNIHGTIYTGQASSMVLTDCPEPKTLDEFEELQNMVNDKIKAEHGANPVDAKIMFFKELE